MQGGMERWVSCVIFSVNILNDVVNTIRKGGGCCWIVHILSDETHHLQRTHSSSIQYITRQSTNCQGARIFIYCISSSSFYNDLLIGTSYRSSITCHVSLDMRGLVIRDTSSAAKIQIFCVAKQLIPTE